MRQIVSALRLTGLMRWGVDLLLALLASLITIPLALLTEGPIRVSFAIPFIIFIPGYCLIAALYPRKDSLDGVERLALSFGTSIAVAPLIGLVLNYTPWGIRLAPILMSLTGFILAMCAVAAYRRSRLNDEERFSLDFQLPQIGWATMGRTDRLLTLALIASIVFAVGTLIYVVTNPKKGEQFTEFYILGTGGMAEGYPSKLKIGQPADLILGVVNHEQESVEYLVQVRLDGDPAMAQIEAEQGSASQAGPGAFLVGPLDDEEKWEHRISVSALSTGERLKLEFLLFSPRPRDGYYLRGLLGEDGYATLQLRESRGQAEVALQPGEGPARECRLEVWQHEELVTQQSLWLEPGQERKLKLSFPSGEARFLVYDGDQLAIDDSGAELSLHLWVSVAKES